MKMNQKLVEYIRKHLRAGHHPDKIKMVLLKAGWHTGIIEEHIAHVLSSRSKANIIDNIKQNLGANAERYFIVALVVIGVIVIVIASLGHFFSYDKEAEIISPGLGTGSTPKENLNLFNKALIENDKDACSQIGEDNLREECENNFIFNETFCDNEDCKDEGLFNRALVESNESLCSHITDGILRQQCVGIFNETGTSEEECDDVCKDKQSLNLALISHNASICSNINDASIRNKCEDVFV